MTAWSAITDLETQTGAIVTQSLMRKYRDNLRSLMEDDASVPLVDTLARMGRQRRVICGTQDDDAVHQFQVGGSLRASYATLGETAPTINPRRILVGYDALGGGEYAIQADQDGVGYERLDLNPLGGAIALAGVPYIWPVADGVGQLTSDGAGNLSWTAGAALAAFWAKIANTAEIAVTAAGVGTVTLNRMHVVSGTAADYDKAISGLSPTAGDILGFRVLDYAAANKQYRLDAGGTVKIAGRTRYLTLLHTNIVLLMWDGTDWQPLVLCLDTPWIDAGASTVTAVTTNPTKGTGTTYDKVYWKRSGKSLHVRYEYRHTVAGAAGSGDYLWLIPIGAMDTSMVTVEAGAGSSNTRATAGLGTGRHDVNSTGIDLYVSAYNSTQLRFAGVNDNAATSGFLSSGYAGFNGNTMRFHVFAELPMANW